ncbi:RnfH family protein [uncultured Cocleimonas sp.]|uniref:RnfH family protein n=1 Tax=uncultured Cocleimonas sp. TaxID=1051587 RepID=UPI0026025E1F|nr:RnfH family protein [uncultured Cocleimonas sp.]
MADKIHVEVIYALPDEQDLLNLEIEEGSEVQQVILESGVLELYPELDLDTMKVGLFGKITTMKQKVRDKDRIEIYRPLIADPKEVRKKRAAEGKVLKKGGSGAAAEKADN